MVIFSDPHVGDQNHGAVLSTLAQPHELGHMHMMHRARRPRPTQSEHNQRDGDDDVHGLQTLAMHRQQKNRRSTNECPRITQPLGEISSSTSYAPRTKRGGSERSAADGVESEATHMAAPVRRGVGGAVHGSSGARGRTAAGHGAPGRAPAQGWRSRDGGRRGCTAGGRRRGRCGAGGRRRGSRGPGRSRSEAGAGAAAGTKEEAGAGRGAA